MKLSLLGYNLLKYSLKSKCFYQWWKMSWCYRCGNKKSLVNKLEAFYHLHDFEQVIFCWYTLLKSKFHLQNFVFRYYWILGNEKVQPLLVEILWVWKLFKKILFLFWSFSQEEIIHIIQIIHMETLKYRHCETYYREI